MSAPYAAAPSTQRASLINTRPPWPLKQDASSGTSHPHRPGERMVIWLVSEIRKLGSPDSTRARVTCPPPIQDRGSARVASTAAANARSASADWMPSSASTVYVYAGPAVPPTGAPPGTVCQVPAPVATKSGPAGSAAELMAAATEPAAPPVG